MKFFNILACTLAAGSMLMTSCLNGKNEDQKNTEVINQCFSYSVNTGTGAVSFDSENSMAITTNYTQATMSVSIANLEINGQKLPAPIFNDLKAKQTTDGWLIAEGSNVRPEVQGFSEANLPLFSNVRLGYINHVAELNGEYLGGWERVVRLTTDDQVIFVSPTDAWSTGNTLVVNHDDHTSFNTTKPIYLVKVDAKKMTANIIVYNAVFAPAMEKLGLVIEFRDIPFSADAMGNITLSRTESFQPYHGNAPHPGFPISNLLCRWDLFSGINISFTCEAQGATYSVSANMPFNYGVTNTGSN